MKRIVISFFLTLVMLCAFATSSRAANVNVSVVDFAFQPQTVTVNVGDSVTWTLSGTALASHTTTSGTGCLPDGSWDSGVLGSQPFQVVFTRSGTYPYFCSFHCAIGMTGTVIVNPAIIPAPTSQTTITFSPVATPVLGPTNTTSMPIGIGALATGGNTLTVAIGLGPYAVPVDVYAAFAISTNPLNIVNILPNLTFQNIPLVDVVQTLSTGIVPAGVMPWMSNVNTEINVTLFSNIPITNIAPGQYTAHLLVTPHGGNFAAFDHYTTTFTIP